ncbi:MAG: GNAT family N-acetyltransferase [Candidatus Saccharimonadales bacterium]
MSFVLRNDFPPEASKSYWYHNSGGEHTQKHSGEPPEINDLRVQRGLEPFIVSELTMYMETSGVVAVHTKYEDGGVGPTIGYAVADRITRPGTLDVKDLYVLPEHQRRGVGGFLLGRLITKMIDVDGNTPGIIKQNYGQTLHLNGNTCRLPGGHLKVIPNVLGTTRVRDMRNAMPPYWSGILEVTGDDIYDAKLYSQGEIIATFEQEFPESHDDPILYRISGQTGSYLHVAYAAIAALNPGKPVTTKTTK